MMLSQGANPGTDDPFKWAYGVWWDRWFPEVLKECREGEILRVMQYCNIDSQMKYLE